MQNLELIQGDRREDRRYDLELDLQFSYQQDGGTCWGVGRTVELSRGGIRFSTETPPPNGIGVELRIHWPFLLQDVIPLQLVMRGTILRSDFRGTVLKVAHYAFRTCGQHSFDQAATPERTCSITA
jgi:hypothetical protein